MLSYHFKFYSITSLLNLLTFLVTLVLMKLDVEEFNVNDVKS